MVVLDTQLTASLEDRLLPAWCSQSTGDFINSVNGYNDLSTVTITESSPTRWVIGSVGSGSGLIPPLAQGRYIGTRYQVTRSVQIPSDSEIELLSNETKGVSAQSPDLNKQFWASVSVETKSDGQRTYKIATFTTFVFDLVQLDGTSIGFWLNPPQDVAFKYRTQQQPQGALCSQLPLVVSRTDDPSPAQCSVNDCSLREAVIASNRTPGPNIIKLPTGTYMLTRNGIDITNDLSIVGAGAANTIIDGGQLDRVFHIQTAKVTLEGLTIRNGKVNGNGGGIFVEGGGSSQVSIIDSIVSNNSATTGGGIYNGSAQLTVQNSTVANNSASSGGGIFNTLSEADVISSTVSTNSAQNGGGLFNDRFGTLLVENSTFANNLGNAGSAVYNADLNILQTEIRSSTLVTDSSSVPDLIHGGASQMRIGNSIIANLVGNGRNCLSTVSTIQSLGYNLVTDGTCNLVKSGDRIIDRGLVKLAKFIDPGVPGMGHFPLLAGSPAIDAGSADACLPADQLNHRRPVDGMGFQGDGIGTCDIGAVEFYRLLT